MSIKITGLDKLQRDLKDAQRAMASLDGTIATLKITPGDPAGAQAAIRQMESAVDSKVAPYGNNALVATVVKAAKERYRAKILELAKSKP